MVHNMNFEGKLWFQEWIRRLLGSYQSLPLLEFLSNGWKERRVGDYQELSVVSANTTLSRIQLVILAWAVGRWTDEGWRKIKGFGMPLRELISTWAYQMFSIFFPRSNTFMACFSRVPTLHDLLRSSLERRCFSFFGEGSMCSARIRNPSDVSEFRSGFKIRAVQENVALSLVLSWLRILHRHEV